MILVIDGKGVATCLYDEAIDLTRFGPLDFHRASHVEPDVLGRWWADLQPVAGPVLGPFCLRSEALTAERAWLEEKLSALGVASPGPDDHRGLTASTQPKQPKGPGNA